MFWGWFVLYVLMMAVFYVRSGEGRSFREFLFPKHIYQSQSFKDDIKLIVFYAGLGILALSARVSIQAWFIAKVGYSVSAPLSGALPNATSDLPFWVVTLILALTLDFGNFLGHLLLHRVPWLWEFHKVHHAAEYLTPATQFRSHPVEPIFKEMVMGSLTGVVAGILFAAKAIPADAGLFREIWRVSLIYHLTFHLRHSHQYFSFGPALSYLFNSPAMHQIHHSIETRHLDKNFAAMFSVWDWLFGTIYIPKSKETFRIGLETKADQAEFRGFWGLMITPFRRLLRPLLRPPREASSL